MAANEVICSPQSAQLTQLHDPQSTPQTLGQTDALCVLVQQCFPATLLSQTNNIPSIRSWKTALSKKRNQEGDISVAKLMLGWDLKSICVGNDRWNVPSTARRDGGAMAFEFSDYLWRELESDEEAGNACHE